MRNRTTDNTEGIHLWLILSKAHKALSTHAQRQIATTGLGVTDFAVLEALWHKGPLPVNTIGRKVLLTSGSISVAVDRLVRQGLVARTEDPSDRRVRRVKLTDPGRRKIGAAFDAHVPAMEQAFAPLTMRERADLARLLKKLGRAVEASLEEGPAKQTRTGGVA